MTRRPTVIDLFCGAGGLSEGFRQAGFRVVAGADNDPDACTTYSANFRRAATICGDIREAVVHEAVITAAKSVDVVVGGPPCQAFSQVRNHDRLIDDPRNSLYREFVSVVGTVLPAAFVMENVPGLEQVGVKSQVLEDLSVDGEYEVRSHALDAADFGVPQTRKRIVFIGIRKRLKLRSPDPSGSRATTEVALTRRNGVVPLHYAADGDDEWLARLLDPEDVRLVTAAQAIGDLSFLEAGTRDDAIITGDLPEPASAYQRMMRERLNGTISNTSVPRINPDTVLRLEGVPEGGNHRDLPDSLTARYLTGARWGPDAGTGRLSRRHYYAYRRLHSQFWSWTLNTKADSVYHYESSRALSVREFARLQSFPDEFVFTTDPRKGPLPGRIDGGAAHSRYRQVGNAVPPLLAAAIARAVKRVLPR